MSRRTQLTPAQQRLFDSIRAQCDGGFTAEYWPTVNDWVKDSGRTAPLAFRNIGRTVDALLRSGLVALSDDGHFTLAEQVAR